MSGFTSVLKSIGIIAAQAGLSYVGLADVGSKLFKTPQPPPGVVPQKLQDIYDAIKRAEFVAGVLGNATLTGEQKRAMVVPALVAAFLDIDDFRGHKPEDEQAFKDNINKAIDGLVGAANSFKK